MDDDKLFTSDESPSELFERFCEVSGTPTGFVILIDDDKHIRTSAAYRRDQALVFAFKLRKMAREIEADFDDPGL